MIPEEFPNMPALEKIRTQYQKSLYQEKGTGDLLSANPLFVTRLKRAIDQSRAPFTFSVSTKSSSTEIDKNIENLNIEVNSLKKEIVSLRKLLNKTIKDLGNRPIIKETKLYDIGDDFIVLEPLPIIIEQYRDEVITSFPEIEISSIAENEPEAILNLKQAIRRLYLDLNSTPTEELGNLPLCWLRILRRLIRTNE